MNKTRISKLMCFYLRHNPDAGNLTMDKHGWVDIEELVNSINNTKSYVVDKELIYEIVKEDNKQRYSLNENKTKIRANQGHSIPVDVDLQTKIPEMDYLYHGTATKYESSINEQGLIPKKRLYVHLSDNISLAKEVGLRHGDVIIYQVNCKEMIKDGYEFKYSENGIWLINEVPVKYIKKLENPPC